VEIIASRAFDRYYRWLFRRCLLAVCGYPRQRPNRGVAVGAIPNFTPSISLYYGDFSVVLSFKVVLVFKTETVLPNSSCLIGRATAVDHAPALLGAHRPCSRPG
jgi:hypothetical protein